MNKALKMRRIWLIVGILSAVFAVAAIPVIALSALSRGYALMGFAIAVCAHGFYGVTFYFLAFAGAGDKYRCLCAVERSGLRSYESISVAVMMTEEATRTTLEKCIKGGYICGFAMGARGLEELKSECEGKRRVCEFCKSEAASSDNQCPNCGATVKND